MSYNPDIGLIQVSGMSIPMKYIKAESYIVTRSITDLDSYRDAKGILHRNALEHNVYKIEFNTPALMTNSDMSDLMFILSRAYHVRTERKLDITAYIPELDDYITQEAYVPDMNFTIYGIFDGIIKYNPVRIAFIGY